MLKLYKYSPCFYLAYNRKGFCRSTMALLPQLGTCELHFCALVHGSLTDFLKKFENYLKNHIFIYILQRKLSSCIYLFTYL